ncbi:VC0807 family protein [Nonomuraea guangzhouensis]|uniref:VC0807 family protein n=1 Tax=Nonomuraea guangzhouensis TaxID=1291555 RepID=A0ABW4GJK6_9ACTN|nr:VC0807 family protein [Nonomuraea guangzhouensis]
MDTRASALSLRGRALISLLLWEIVPPIGAFYLFRLLGYGSYVALLVGAGVAALRTVYVAVRHRAFDGAAVFLLVLFGTGLALTLVTGDERFLLAKGSIHVAFLGLLFLGTCLVGRPLTFHLAKRFVAGDIEAKWDASPAFRRGFYTAALVWGFGMLADAAIHIPVIFLLPIDVAVAVSYVLHFADLAALTLWTRWYRLRAQRRAATDPR